MQLNLDRKRGIFMFNIETEGVGGLGETPLTSDGVGTRSHCIISVLVTQLAMLSSSPTSTRQEKKCVAYVLLYTKCIKLLPGLTRKFVLF